ncbi:MAG: ABC transporter permease [Ignavibacteriales bacterium]|nr:MAG: ABC transporter permease [Ignavibacteriales bacterium]
MFKNYVKIAIRRLLRSKVYSLINIAGLAIGMSSCILILLWVQDEFSFNKFHKDLDNIFIVPQTQFYAGGREFKVYNSSAPLGPALKAEYPEVVHSARYAPYQGEMLMQYGNKSFTEEVKLADPDFFRIFSFPFITGDKNNSFPQVHSLVLTEDAAKKYFGDENPVGKIIRINTKFDFLVSGVLKNIPSNSDLKFDVVLPFEFLKELGVQMDSWFSNSYWTFIKLKDGIQWQDFSLKIKNRLKKEGEDVKNELFFFQFSDFHLYTLDGNNQPIDRVRLFIIIAFVILIIACINFMNLSTARSAKRSREVGLRKVVGANRSQLINQFFGESILLTFFALCLSLLLVEILLNGFNELAGKEIEINYLSNNFFLIVIAVAVITGIISGSYPAIFLSSFSPVKILKENLNTGNKGSFLRRILVIIQFSLSIILLVSTIVVYNQLNFMKNKEVGYNKENVFYIPAKGNLIDKYEVLKKRLLNDKNILNVSISSHRPSFVWTNGGGYEWEGKDPNEDVLISMMTVDEDFQKTFDLKIAEGRFFSNEYPADTIDAVVINEKFANLMGEGQKAGSIIKRDEENYRVIGVLKEFNFNPVKFPIEPLIMWYSKSWANYIFIKANGQSTSEAIEYTQKIHSEINPSYPFNYTFLNDEFDKIFKTEERLGKLFNYFAVLAVLISCLGLFGLASFMAEQRRKEIGVRKVLGSSILQIVILLSKSFTSLVLIANIIAWPFAYFFMKDWLNDFAYRIDLNIGFFILSGLIALVVALLAVTYQAVKAASANPVKSLRYE